MLDETEITNRTFETGKKHHGGRWKLWFKNTPISTLYVIKMSAIVLQYCGTIPNYSETLPRAYCLFLGWVAWFAPINQGSKFLLLCPGPSSSWAEVNKPLERSRPWHRPGRRGPSDRPHDEHMGGLIWRYCQDLFRNEANHQRNLH